MKVAFGKHFEKMEWQRMMDLYVRTDKTEIAGVCPACEKEVEVRRWLRKEAVLRLHSFQICLDYPWSNKIK